MLVVVEMEREVDVSRYLMNRISKIRVFFICFRLIYLEFCFSVCIYVFLCIYCFFKVS